MRADARGQVAARTQLFLDLRTRFLGLLEDLPPNYRSPEWEPSDPKHREAVVRYWHHAFDEWYVTRRLNEKLMRPLWDQFYCNAILTGLRHNGLRKIFIEMTKNDVELAKLWSEFKQELDRVWAKDHPKDGTQCAGITCNHKSAKPPAPDDRGGNRLAEPGRSSLIDPRTGPAALRAWPQTR